MTLKIGDRIPMATLAIMDEAGPQSITSTELLEGKRVVLFGVPGAFTPTCSARHLYAMVVDDGVVQAFNVDKPGEFLVSDAQTVLGLL